MEQQSTALQRLAQRRRRIGQVGVAISLLVVGLVVSINWWPAAKPPTKLGPVDWHSLRSASGRFTTNMPGSPVETTQQVTFFDKPLPMHVFEGESSEITYVIRFTDFPPEALSAYAGPELLSASRKLVEVIRGGKITDEHSISLGDIEGRERRIEESSVRDPQRAVVRVFIVKGRLYQLVVLGKTTFDELTRSAAQLFDSFRPTQ